MVAEDSPPVPSAGLHEWRKAHGAIIRAWLRLLLPLVIVSVAYAARIPEPGPEEVFVWRQDLPALAILSIVLLALRFVKGAPSPRVADREAVFAWGLAAGALVVAGLGARLVFEGHTFSLDEHLANFDADIFSRGQLMAELGPAWRRFAAALQPLYMLEAPGRAYWASAYLPVNAAFRAIGGALGLRDWINPFWAAVAIVSTFGVGRLIWPENPRRALAASLLLATSAQFLVMSMSAYAMSTYLALNMLWLWLFLRGRLGSDIAALGVAFLACGVHQVAFHPFFAAPFILELLLARRWRRAMGFTAAYAVIGLFWISYPGLVFSIMGMAPEQADAVGAGWFAGRVLELLRGVHAWNLFLMAESLLRFATWQSVLAVPLGAIGLVAGLRSPGVMRPLSLGLVLTCLAMLVLMPTQTHGWGYRYLHGFLGSLALLAVFGWTRLTASLEGEDRARAKAAFAAAAVASLALMLPLRAWQAHRFAHPYVVALEAMKSSGAEIVLVDNGTVGFDAGTFVQNDPYLRGPKVMLLGMLSPADLDDFCRRYRVAIFDGHHPSAAGILTYSQSWSSAAVQLRGRLRTTGCPGLIRSFGSPDAAPRVGPSDAPTPPAGAAAPH